MHHHHHHHHSAHLHANSTPSNGTVAGMNLPISASSSSGDAMRYGTRPQNVTSHPIPSNLAAMAAAAVAVAAATNPSNPSTPSSTIAQASSLYPQVAAANDIGSQIIPPHVSNSIAVTQAPDSSIPTWSQDSNAYLNAGTSGHSTSGDSNNVHSNLVSN